MQMTIKSVTCDLSRTPQASSFTRAAPSFSIVVLSFGLCCVKRCEFLFPSK